MDVVVKSRHCSVPDSFRSYVEDKITRLERLNDRVIRVEVEVSAEKNKRQHDQACRVEITLRSKGPVVRAEAAAGDKFAAFDLALDRLMAQLRRAADRRRIHHGSKKLQTLTDVMNGQGAPDGVAESSSSGDDSNPAADVAGIEVDGDGPMVVREKVHSAAPMTLDQALLEMELVGHDFYLFVDTDHRPSVVYRRRAYDYGVIRLEVSSNYATL